MVTRNILLKNQFTFRQYEDSINPNSGEYVLFGHDMNFYVRFAWDDMYGWHLQVTNRANDITFSWGKFIEFTINEVNEIFKVCKINLTIG